MNQENDSRGPSIKISLDGGQTWAAAPQGVHVLLEKVDVPGEGERGQLDFKFTHEGVITDVWVTREEPLDHNIATRSQEYVDILSGMVEADS